MRDDLFQNNHRLRKVNTRLHRRVMHGWLKRQEEAGQLNAVSNTRMYVQTDNIDGWSAAGRAAL
jgi:hypothetical protein